MTASHVAPCSNTPFYTRIATKTPFPLGHRFTCSTAQNYSEKPLLRSAVQPPANVLSLQFLLAFLFVNSLFLQLRFLYACSVVPCARARASFSIRFHSFVDGSFAIGVNVLRWRGGERRVAVYVSTEDAALFQNSLICCCCITNRSVILRIQSGNSSRSNSGVYSKRFIVPNSV